jgi:hypothetical protein
MYIISIKIVFKNQFWCILDSLVGTNLLPFFFNDFCRDSEALALQLSPSYFILLRFIYSASVKHKFKLCVITVCILMKIVLLTYGTEHVCGNSSCFFV